MQILDELTVIIGSDFMVTVATAVLKQPFVVPVTVYVVFVFNIGVVGVAVAAKPPDHVYVVAPLAVIVAVKPLHTLGLFTVIVGFGFTVTIAIAVFVQPFVVPVTV